MAIKNDRAKELAQQMAVVLAQEIYGDEGPDLDCDIDEFEDLAVLAARSAFDAVIARALILQNEKLPDHLPCPKCQQACVVKTEERTIHGRMGPAEIQEPLCHCSVCDRDFFPSA